jgi:NAD(P)-dependent dehydrogenase (short-subunit alcohol dehydrogenase family)
MSARAAFGYATTAEEVTEEIDLRGQRAIVTGASGGLGAETARVLAMRGAAVTLAARDLPKTQRVFDAIRQETPGAELEVLELELSHPDRVRASVQRWLGEHEKLDLLINNAGVMACPLTRTAEGWEMQFATNHLGHFLFTNGLKTALASSGRARVVSLTSGGHRGSDVVFEDIHFDRRPYEKWSGYGQGKTANILFAVELDRRWRSLGIRANAVHPGAIETDLNRHLTEADMTALLKQIPGGKMKHKTLGAGAATTVWAATAPELEEEGGHYLEDCHIAAVQKGGIRGVESYALDATSAARLWQVSEEHLGERFE